jgi:hypothetical protein
MNDPIVLPEGSYSRRRGVINMAAGRVCLYMQCSWNADRGMVGDAWCRINPAALQAQPGVAGGQPVLPGTAPPGRAGDRPRLWLLLDNTRD